jgi:hypothetical protein
VAAEQKVDAEHQEVELEAVAEVLETLLTQLMEIQTLEAVAVEPAGILIEQEQLVEKVWLF